MCIDKAPPGTLTGSWVDLASPVAIRWPQFPNFPTLPTKLSSGKKQGLTREVLVFGGSRAEALDPVVFAVG